MSITKKFTTSILAATLLAGAFGSMGQAQASGLSVDEAAAIAGLGGFIIGAAVGSSVEHHRHSSRVIYVDDRFDSHEERCMMRYRTYDPHTDTYIGYDGYEHYCRL